MNHDSRHPIEIGIAFVVMRRNIDDLRHLNRFAHSVGAKRVSVSNVLPYSEEMEKEILFAWVQNLENFVYWPGRMNIDLPRIDFTNTTKEALFKLLNECANISIAGNRISRGAGRCRFIDDRCTFIKWDGTVSPCMGLLHSYKTYLNSCERTIRCHSMGEISPQDLWDIWNSTEYTDFRERVRSFEFSPCHVCGGCSLMEKNEEDCYESGFPACGGCLWAHGIIQCP